MTKWIPLALYILFVIASALFALFCDFTYCQLLALLPASPWIQLFEGALSLSLPQVALPLFFILNGWLCYLLGISIHRLITR
jgi:hypothetical protein